MSKKIENSRDSLERVGEGEYTAIIFIEDKQKCINVRGMERLL